VHYRRGMYLGVVDPKEVVNASGDYDRNIAYIEWAFPSEETFYTCNIFKEGYSGKHWKVKLSTLMIIDWTVDVEKGAIHIAVNGEVPPWPIFSQMSRLHECVPYVAFSTGLIPDTISIESEDE